MRHALATARRHARRHGWLRLPVRDRPDVGVKPGMYLPVYEELLEALRFRRVAILELGVWHGDSLEMWRDAFPRATIVGVDLVPPDLELGPRVHIVKGDQTDAQLMTAIRERHAPGGFDVIIDDASHIGIASARSLQALFRAHLKPGGLYFIEDWGTGYLADWYDGGGLSALVGEATLDASAVPMLPDHPAPIPMPSHDLGLVGLVKRLVDHTSALTFETHQPDMVADALPVEWLRVHHGVVALRKRR